MQDAPMPRKPTIRKPRGSTPKISATNVAKIVVVVDSIENPQNRRPCFWSFPEWDVWFREHDASASFISIADQIRSGKNPAPSLFDKDSCDIILISWDAINGDPVFGSDIALSFFRHYRPRLIKWIHEGGIIVIEAQTADLRLVQEVYDVFTFLDDDYHYKFPVTVYARQAFGSKVRIVSKKLNHPLLDNWPTDAPITDRTVLHGGWGNHHKVSSSVATPLIQFSPLYDINALKTTLYRGWFTKFHRAWEPLLFANTWRRHPVMLWLPQINGGIVGACILTTMHLSIPNFIEGRVILANLLQLKAKVPNYLLEQRVKKRQLIQQLVGALAVGGITFAGIKVFGTGILESVLSGLSGSAIAFMLGRFLSKK